MRDHTSNIDEIETASKLARIVRERCSDGNYYIIGLVEARNVIAAELAARRSAAERSHAALRAALEEISTRSKAYIDCLSNYGAQDDRTISALGHLCNAHNAARRALEE